MQNEEKKSWGGARKGAGRKSKPHGKTFTFRSSVEVEEILNKVDSNKAEFINEAILYFVKNNGSI